MGGERRVARFLWALALAASAALFGVFAFRHLNDWDLGYHLSCGRWMVRHGLVFNGYPLVYTYPDHPYTDPYTLWQLGLYGLWRAFGYPALTAASAALALALAGVMAWRLRLAKAPAALAAPLLLAAVVGLELRFQVRPEQVSWLCLALELALLDLAWRGRVKAVWLLPPLHLVWVNSHGSLAPLGLGAMALALASMAWRDRALCRPLAWALGLSILASLANPYGLDGFAFPWRLLAHNDPSDPFKAMIGEFSSPYRGVANAVPASVWAFRLGGPLLLAAALLAARTGQWHQAALSAAMFALAVSMVRNVPLFFIAAVPAAAEGLMSLGPVAARAKAWSVRAAPALAALALALWLALRAATGAWYALEERPNTPGAGLEANPRVPVAAARFLAEQAPRARLYNSFGDGGWLGWLMDAPVYQDGQTEAMGAGFFRREVLEVEQPGGLARGQARWGFDAVAYFRPSGESLTQQLVYMPDWRLAYWDDWSCVWLKNNGSSAAPAVDWGAQWAALGIRHRFAGEAEALLMAPPRWGLARWLRPDVVGIQRGLALTSRGAFAYSCLQAELTEGLLLEALAADPDCSLAALNLGVLYHGQGRIDLARLAWERALQLDAGNALAARGLKALSGAQ